MPQLMENIQNGIANQLQPTVKDHADRINKNGRAIAEMQAVVTRHDSRHTSLEAELASCKRQVEGAASLASHAGSHSNPPTPSSSAPSVAGHEWRPRYVEIKGFCEFEDGMKSGVARGEAMIYVEGLKQRPQPELKAQVGEVHLRAHMNTAIRLDVNPDYAVELQGTLRDILDAGGHNLRGKTPFPVLEKPPRFKARYQAMGRARDGLKKAVYEKNPCWTLDCGWIGFNLSIVCETGNVHVAQVAPNAALQRDEAARRKLLNLSPADALAMSRRR